MRLEYSPLKTRAINVLNKKGVYTLNDLACFFPRAYHDYRKVRTIEECIPNGQTFYAVSAVLIHKETRRMAPSSKMPRGRQYIVLRFASGSAYFGATLFGVYDDGTYDRLLKKEVVVLGRVSVNESGGRKFLNMNPDSILKKEDFAPCIQPVYPGVSGISEPVLHGAVKRCAQMAGEILEPEIVEEAGLLSYREALLQMHAPESIGAFKKARERICFNDLVYFEYNIRKDKSDLKETSGFVFPKSAECIRFANTRRFSLTGGQKAALNVLVPNTAKGIRNNVLIQGDVGCGKTLIAQVMAVNAWENGYQTVLMAPKNRLARQHFESFAEDMKELGINIVFFNSAVTGRARKQMLEDIKTGKAQIIIGTQSCIGRDVKYRKLGLIIEDEEQQFGVNDKEGLIKKANAGVHTIFLSATPISRTVTDILYGDKTVIRIKDKPAERLPIITTSARTDQAALEKVLEEVKSGHQAYFIAPAITDNEDYGLVGIDSLKLHLESFFGEKGCRVGVLHGQMKEKEAEAVMEAFKNKEFQILLSTTVIDVGINVPNATVIVIEQAERFGASQLHQLRGRVGRGSAQSYCYLIGDDTSNERVSLLCRTADGFEIAEADMGMRGPGDLLGVRQSGQNKYIDEILSYPETYEKAKAAAGRCLEMGYGKVLLAIYDEHEACRKEYEEEKAARKKKGEG